LGAVLVICALREEVLVVLELARLVLVQAVLGPEVDPKLGSSSAGVYPAAA